MSELDIKQPCVIGLSANRSAQVKMRVEKRCDGCGEKVYLSRPLLSDARRMAKRQGSGIQIVCWKCAQPWIDDVATNGGDVKAETTVMESELIPAIEAARQRRIETN